MLDKVPAPGQKVVFVDKKIERGFATASAEAAGFLVVGNVYTVSSAYLDTSDGYKDIFLVLVEDAAKRSFHHRCFELVKECSNEKYAQ